METISLAHNEEKMLRLSGTRLWPRVGQVSPTTATLSAAVYSNLGDRAARSGHKVYALHVGDTYRPPLEAARAEKRLQSEDPKLHNYSPVAGEPVLLDAIQNKLRRRSLVQRVVPKDLIQVTVGGTSGFNIIASSLFDPGEEVLILAPFWPLIRGCMASRGVVPTEVPYFTRLAEEPSLSLTDLLEHHINPRVCAVYVNTPSNPTGNAMPERHVAELAAVARKHSLLVISDEAYQDLYYTAVPPRPLWDYDDLQDITIANHTMSKGYGLAGARIGWIHGPRSVMPAVQGVQTFLTYCASRPFQIGAAAALNGGTAWQRESREMYKEAGYGVADTLGVPRPEGSTFLFVNVKKYLRPGETTADLMGRIADRGVLVSPGRACGKDFADYIRICYTCIPTAETLEAAAILRDVLHSK